ncbi:hypothetical protein [Paraburkholderia sediminicola]|uniref:hypothetical protein n=1 Tax=Paraburkholderia sediminicola TaxID=458836 RepID=UPI0038BCD686
MAPSTKLRARYLHCIAESAYFNEVAARAAADGMLMKSLDAGHMGILTHVKVIADVLLLSAKT